MEWYFKKNRLGRAFCLFVLLMNIVSCGDQNESNEIKSGVELVVLGTIQDAGSPQIGCEKKCCRPLFKKGASDRMVVSLGLIDHGLKTQYLFEATPNLPMQFSQLQRLSENKKMPDGIFITHAHIGHYTGLMYLGKEAMNSKNVKVYAMDGMQQFLENNGPWNQLVSNANIRIENISTTKEITLNKHLKVSPFLVPHRDEYSETVGYKIKGQNKTALFIPDIDKWSKWEKDIIKEIEKVDYAFIDGTFYSGAEINNRDISEIPHPFIQESMDAFKDLEPHQKNKIYFIHFNHTNPVLDPNSKASKRILKKGFHIARKHDRFSL